MEGDVGRWTLWIVGDDDEDERTKGVPPPLWGRLRAIRWRAEGDKPLRLFLSPPHVTVKRELWETWERNVYSPSAWCRGRGDRVTCQLQLSAGRERRRHHHHHRLRRRSQPCRSDRISCPRNWSPVTEVRSACPAEAARIPWTPRKHMELRMKRVGLLIRETRASPLDPAPTHTTPTLGARNSIRPDG